MKITCDSCGAKYTIADDKVRGRKVKIRCKGCGTPIVVDGQQEGASTASDDAPSSELDATIPLEAPASTGGDGEWSVNLSETEQRTLSTSQIVEAWRDGSLTSDAFVWREGMTDWLPILECAELAQHLNAAGPAASPSAASPSAASSIAVAPAAAVLPAATATKAPSSPTSAERPPSSAARVAGGRAQGAPDLFAGVARAGADEEEVSTSAPALPQAGTRPYEDDRLTGARNENSVLFSLDALKAGFSGPAAKPAAPSAERRSGAAPSAADPFGMGSASSLPGLGGSAPLFTLADNQALLTAPPPPDPPPRPVEAAFSPSGGASVAPALGKRNLILLGAGAVVLLVAGLALGIGLGKKDDDTATTGPGASASALAAAEKSDGKREEKSDTPDENPVQGAKADTSPDAGATAETPAASATAGTAKATAPAVGGARKDPPKKEEPKKEEPKPAAGADQPFNKAAAISALNSAAGQAGSCKKIGGPTGSGKVSVTFAPSGRATSANVVGPPFSGTAVGGCIASVFRRAKVPPFSGSSLTVSKSFTIN